jgi:hypothetical protein
MRTLIKAGIRIIIILMTLEILLSSVSNLVYYLTFSAPYESADLNYFVGSIGSVTFSFLVTVLILFIVWRKTDWLTRLVAGEINDSELTINTNNVELITVAVRILGIIFVVINFRLLVALIGNRWIFGSMYPGVQMQNSVYDITQWIASIVGLLLGIWLTLGGKGIVTALDKIWSAQQAGKSTDTEK